MTLEDVRHMETELHSDSMEEPFGPSVLLHWWWFLRAIIMREAIGTPRQRNAYVASVIITPWHWLRWGHWKLFRGLNKKLRGGGSAGETFRQVNGTQNRLLLIRVPAIFVPDRLLAKSDIKDDELRIDVYELGGFLPRFRRFLQYGVFGDFCPESVPPPKKRVSLGSRLVWWLAGKPNEFAVRLRTQDDVGRNVPVNVLKIARMVGVAKACALLPILLVLAVFAKDKKTA